MAPSETTPVETLAEYVAAVVRVAGELHIEGASDGPWFRGANNADHGLTPGAYWRKGVDEEALVVEFTTQAPPYFRQYGTPHTAPGDLWEWYFLMQHYGLPTRLLDWSENALVGLFFALSPAGPKPCVWLLDPARMNDLTIGDGRVIAPGGSFSAHWLPMVNETQVAGCKQDSRHAFDYNGAEYSNGKPIAIYGPRLNGRILAQQGVFTVHGADTMSIDELLAVPKSPLARINVAPHSRSRLLEELELCGINEVRLFPELDKLAPHLKRRLGIEP